VLNEQHLFTPLEPASVRRWDEAFAALEKYAQHLALLTSTSLTANYRSQALRLANDLGAIGEEWKLRGDPALQSETAEAIGAGLLKLSELLIRHRAQASAITVAREADPTLQRLLAQMQAAVGSTRNEGLRGTAWAQWTQRKAEKQRAFLHAPDLPAKRALVIEFLSVSDQQAGQDASLASLERSWCSLARAHQALATRDTLTLTQALAQIETEIQDARRLYAEFKRLWPNPP
jgi:hypothetical protein